MDDCTFQGVETSLCFFVNFTTFIFEEFLKLFEVAQGLR